MAGEKCALDGAVGREYGRGESNPSMNAIGNSGRKNSGIVTPGGRESRQHRRFELSIPVEVLTPESAGPAAIQTASRNISAKGVYFTIAPEASLDSQVEFFMTLPPQMCQGRTVRVHCQGRVVRREALDGEGCIGVAAAIDQYEFIPVD